MNRIFALALAAASFAIVPSASAREQSGIQQATAAEPVPTSTALAPTSASAGILTSVPITCTNPGSSQDVAKTPSLVNSTSTKIPAGKMVFFKASDGDVGTLLLPADLLPGASVKLQGAKPGQVYTCTGSFYSQADLVVAKASMGMTSATVDIRNMNPWVDAVPSTVRLQVINCSGNTVQKTVYSTAMPVPKSSIRTVTFPVTSVGRVYFKVLADGQKVVPESNEYNNEFESSHNSCLY
jgi:hypothetical protein